MWLQAHKSAYLRTAASRSWIRPVSPVRMPNQASRPPTTTEYIPKRKAQSRRSMAKHAVESQLDRDPERLREDQLRLMSKLFTYASGSVGSNVFPITENDLYELAGGLSPISCINFAVSVARKTCSATVL